MNENETFELIDENGEKETFTFLATIEHDNKIYLCAQPHDIEDMEKQENGEYSDMDEEDIPVVFFRCDFPEDESSGEDVLTLVTDEKLLDQLFETFLSQMEDEENDDSDDNEEE